MTIQEQIISTAREYGVAPNLALAVARRESNFNQAAVSPAGAVGIMQLMPATARELGVDPYDLTQNIAGGVRYLAQLLRAYAGDLERTLAAYNWGPGHLAEAVQRYGERWISYIPQETKNYLRDVLNLLGSWLPPEGPAGTPTSSPAGSGEQEGVNWILLGLAGILFFFLLAEP